jgi:hypothetical protein
VYAGKTKDNEMGETCSINETEIRKIFYQQSLKARDLFENLKKGRRMVSK